MFGIILYNNWMFFHRNTTFSRTNWATTNLVQKVTTCMHFILDFVNFPSSYTTNMVNFHIEYVYNFKCREFNSLSNKCNSAKLIVQELCQKNQHVPFWSKSTCRSNGWGLGDVYKHLAEFHLRKNYLKSVKLTFQFRSLVLLSGNHTFGNDLVFSFYWFVSYSAIVADKVWKDAYNGFQWARMQWICTFISSLFGRHR